MISLGSATRVFIVTGPTDMRKSFNGLYAIVKHKLQADATSGHVYVFCNSTRNRIKLLVWMDPDSGSAPSDWRREDSVGSGLPTKPPYRSPMKT